MDRDEHTGQPVDRGALSGLDRERCVAALEAMAAITRAIGDKTGLGTLLQSVAERCRALVDARVLLIELAQEDLLLIAAGAGELPERLIGQRVPLAGSLVERVLRTHASMRVEVGSAQFAETAVDGIGLQAHTGLVVPLLSSERAFGALIALDPPDGRLVFSGTDARLLEALAAAVTAALAVAHACHADAERLALIVNSSPDAIVTTDEQGTVTGWNAGAEDLYGYAAAEMIGQPAALVLSRIVPAERHDDIALLARVLGGENVKDHVTMRVRKDGTRAAISLRAEPIRDHYGTTVGLVSFTRHAGSA